MNTAHPILSVNDFLEQIDYNNIQQLNSPEILAVHDFPILQNFKFFTGKDLLKLNVQSEGSRLNVFDESIIKEALNRLWLDPILKANFSALAEEINNANINKKRFNDENLSKITQLGPQKARTSFEDDMFNGVNHSHFNNDKIQFGHLYY
ncbi:hypothetical protein RhiirA4_423297 [Rhizophagus irregularis]|uniref:Uncharacterized protein n=1 Tax=Rhizophagus irregularis TaxID=588596 RepID=A0A2I1GTM6_9GLOM|nr:hypothetical protein RhiirA4_423297 [Rhizophagus irregularis]